MTGLKPYKADMIGLRALSLPPESSPLLTVVVDTEEEFDWDGGFDPANDTVANIAHQHLAQAIFRRHGIIPTYAVDYPVAVDRAATAQLRQFYDASECEIGAHLHPWVTPPGMRAVDPWESFPGNLSPDEERAKLAVLTRAIETAFGAQPRIYKAGRYGLGPATYETLLKLEYQIDVSLVPYTSFVADGGPDFAAVGDTPYAAADRLIALPLSVGFVGAFDGAGPRLYPRITSPIGRSLRLPGIASRLGLLERIRLSPEGHSLTEMKRLVEARLARNAKLFMLTYHSSSLMPGAAPYVRTAEDRARFLRTLDDFLAWFLTEKGGRGVRVSTLAGMLRRD